MPCGPAPRLLFVAVFALAVTAHAAKVNPNGNYSMAGQYLWRNSTFQFQGNHSGKFKVNKFDMTGTATEDNSYKTTYALKLSQKVGWQGQTNLNVSGQVLRTLPNVHQTIYTMSGAASFKVASNRAVIYAVSLAGTGTAGHDLGAVYQVYLKGKKPKPAS